MSNTPNNHFQKLKRDQVVSEKESFGSKKSIPCIILETYDRDYFEENGIPEQLKALVFQNASLIYCKVQIENRIDYLPLGITPEEFYSLYSDLVNYKGNIVYYDTGYDSRVVFPARNRNKGLDSINRKVIVFDIGGVI